MLLLSAMASSGFKRCMHCDSSGDEDMPVDKKAKIPGDGHEETTATTELQDLQHALMSVGMNEGEIHPCSTCPKRVTKNMIDDWNHWVCVAQDDEGLKTLQTYFNMYVKVGFGVSYTSKKGTGIYIMMCPCCMMSYKSLFHLVATMSPENLPNEYRALKEATGEKLMLLKTIARLLCHQLVNKKFDDPQEQPRTI